MPKPSLCLNMIVKNEAARIDRCLNSVLPYVKAVAVLDTGSTDQTKEMIETLCIAAGVPYVIAEAPFENFSQARNLAFELARDHNSGSRWCQFALLVDADMQLVVDDPHAFDNLDANAPSYDMTQKGGVVSYLNRRLINLNVSKPPYVGVTHEYIDVPSSGMITGARFIDHADGANRVNKYERDAQLLEEALLTDPNNGRYWYYLGNTYRDWGRPAEACSAYMKRISLGGWAEETHNAQMCLAHCKKDLDDLAGFQHELIASYNFRPSRAEPLFDLAKYYREKGDNAASLLFSKQGVNIKRPDDVLFVNDYVYEHGLRYEYAVAGYYDEKERSRAFQVTDDLALDPTCPAEQRWSARTNLYWFTKRLSEYCPSLVDKRLAFQPPPGYTAMNPSVEVCNGVVTCNIRCVNYTINEHGQYMIGEKGCGDAPIDTRNFVALLDNDLNRQSEAEIIWHRNPAKFPLVTGLEDVRLYRSRGDLWFSACVREQSASGTCQQARGRLQYDPADYRFLQVHDFQILSAEERHEKNWMPMQGGKFVYRLDTIYHADVRATTTNPCKVHVDDISGSSQLIPFRAGWLAVVHEASNGPDNKRTYWHRFAWFEQSGALRRLSLPFVFLDRQIEFCAGLAQHPDGNNLLISFGVRDAEAHIAKVNIEEVAAMIWKFHEN